MLVEADTIQEVALDVGRLLRRLRFLEVDMKLLKILNLKENFFLANLKSFGGDQSVVNALSPQDVE